MPNRRAAPAAHLATSVLLFAAFALVTVVHFSAPFNGPFTFLRGPLRDGQTQIDLGLYGGCLSSDGGSTCTRYSYAIPSINVAAGRDIISSLGLSYSMISVTVGGFLALQALIVSFFHSSRMSTATLVFAILAAIVEVGGWIAALVFLLPTFSTLQDDARYGNVRMGNCIYMLGGSVFALLFAIPFAAVAARRERLCATYQMHRDETSRLSSDGSTLDEYKKEQNRPVWRTQRSWREEEMRSSSSM